MRSSRLLRILVSTVLAACLCAPVTGFAYTQSDATAHQKAADAARAKAAAEQKRANDLLAQTRSIDDRIDALEKELASLGTQIGSASERRSRLDKEIAVTRADIAVKQAEIATLQADYDTRVAALNARVDFSYRSGDWAWLEMLLGSTDLADFIQRTEFVNMIISDDEQAAAELDGTRVDLEAISAELDRAVQTLQTKRAEVAAQEQGLKTLQSSRDSKRDAEQSARSEKSALLTASRKRVARYKAMALAEEQESARITRLLKGGSSTGNGKYAGTFRWPTPGHTRISSSFGWRTHPIYHVRKFHYGIDIAAPSGSTIVAAGSGTVISAGYNGGYGNFTMIDHGNGLVSCYAHQSKILVSRGQRVSAGAAIGRVGSTGASTGPHLHFEVRVNGTARSPMSYL